MPTTKVTAWAFTVSVAMAATRMAWVSSLENGRSSELSFGSRARATSWKVSFAIMAAKSEWRASAVSPSKRSAGNGDRSGPFSTERAADTTKNSGLSI